MKYPWMAISLAVVWFGSTYLILYNAKIDNDLVLISAIIGTIVMAFIGFRPPKIK